MKNSMAAEAAWYFSRYLGSTVYVAILGVITKHFTTDSLGNNLQDELDYCKSFVGDYDPFSYYAHLEGIGLPDKKFDDESFDNSDRFNKKENP